MTDDETQLRADASAIERLLGELRDLVAAPVWQRIDEVLRCVVDLHGAGLARALEAGRRAGADASKFRALVGEDDLLGSLLVLHGLHPLSTGERVERALVAVRAELGLADEALVLVGIEDGVVQLRATASIGGGAMADRVAEGAISRVIEAAAPEIVSTRIDGLTRPPAGASTGSPVSAGLVQLRIGRRAP